MPIPKKPKRDYFWMDLPGEHHPNYKIQEFDCCASCRHAEHEYEGEVRCKRFVTGYFEQIFYREDRESHSARFRFKFVSPFGICDKYKPLKDKRVDQLSVHSAMINMLRGE